MSCCYRPDQQTNNACCPPKETQATRYPIPKDNETRTFLKVVDHAKFKQAPPPARPQFEEYPRKQRRSGRCAPEPYTYSGEYLASCNFPLGSFGTGQVILKGDGTLQGWTVVNNFDTPEYTPLHNMPANFFAISARPEGEGAQSYILCSPENYIDANCYLPKERQAHVSRHAVQRMESMPGIKGLTLRGQYPIADVQYDIPGFPVSVALEALSPLIPHEANDSAIPVAVFTFTLTNSSSKDVAVDMLQSQQNFVGWTGTGDCTQAGQTPFWGGNINTPIEERGVSGLHMSNSSPAPATDLAFGSIFAGAIPSLDTTTKVIPGVKTEQDLWNDFVGGKAIKVTDASATPKSPPGSSWCGGVVQSLTVKANSTAKVQFVLSWYFANRDRDTTTGKGREHILPKIIGNYYQYLWPNAKEVAIYLATFQERLLGMTRLYRDTLFSSTMPPEILDSAAGRVSVMRSPTMFWSKDGIVLGNEGNNCCPLNCTHVYGYTTLIERLYPKLAMDMRMSEFVRHFDKENDAVFMRFGIGGPAIDGSLASIIKTHLVVQQADREMEFLPAVWPNVKATMERYIKLADRWPDGIIRAPQQNTYDTPMSGANTFIGSYWVTALRSCGAMATLMGEDKLAASYHSRAEEASKNYEKICWKQEYGYYVADVTHKDSKFSYGPGCFVDQLCAAGLSFATGQGYLFNKDHEMRARRAIATYNVVEKPGFQDMQLHFFDGDKGICVCTYPHGKLDTGMMYEDIVSTGFTSPVIAGLIHDGQLELAAETAKHIRQRHDGRNRSPWDEPECNTLYSRAMAHWNLYDQACGFKWDSTKGRMAFDPKWSAEDFKCFFSGQESWGQYTQVKDPKDNHVSTHQIQVLYGTLQLNALELTGTPEASVQGDLDGQHMSMKWDMATSTVLFHRVVNIPTGSILRVRVNTSPDSRHGLTDIQNCMKLRKDHFFACIIFALTVLSSIAWLLYRS